MKNLVFLLLIATVSVNTYSQVFHFETNSYTLIKTSDQSPAHWYIEIVNDISVDTNLRWKAFFETIPSAWEISFNDQTSNKTNIQDGDSSDFTLFVEEEFLQKLIIGAKLNNQPGIGSVYFEIYDPALPSHKDTIQFQFIISVLGLAELENACIISFQNDVLKIVNDIPTSIQICDANGRVLAENDNFTQFDCSKLEENQLFFIKIQQGSKYYAVKWFR